MEKAKVKIDSTIWLLYNELSNKYGGNNMESVQNGVHNTPKLDARSKYTYSAGGIGRDMAYTFINLFFIVYIQYTMNLSPLQFGVLSGILVVYRIWDAINDPIMGVMIQNTETKWGKFKPWILAGALSNALILVALFTIRPEGWLFVIFFAVFYLLWDITFTMNDIAYWSMLPALSRDQKTRTQLTSLVSLSASIGAFIAGGLVPFFTTGDAVNAYKWFAIIFASAFVLCQIMTVIGVRKRHNHVKEEKQKQEAMSLKRMYSLVMHNKQLLVMSGVIFLYYLGGALLNAFGINFFYFEFGYEGGNLTIFTIVYALATIIAQLCYPFVAKVFTRDQILKYSFIMIVIGYGLFTFAGFVPFLPLNIVFISILGLFVFVGQGLFYIAILVMMTNTIEYEEYHTGERNESILFSLRPFMAKMSSAVQQGVVSIVLLASGLYGLSQEISLLEEQKADGLISNEQLLSGAQLVVEQAEPWMLMILRAGMCVLPLLLMAVAYILIKRKYTIDEKTYDMMVKEIEKRQLASETK